MYMKTCICPNHIMRNSNLWAKPQVLLNHEYYWYQIVTTLKRFVQFTYRTWFFLCLGCTDPYTLLRCGHVLWLQDCFLWSPRYFQSPTGFHTVCQYRLPFQWVTDQPCTVLSIIRSKPQTLACTTPGKYPPIRDLKSTWPSHCSC